MLGILFTNVTVIICLFKTNQTRNLSFRTILHLSFSDVLVALVALPTFIFGTVNKTNSRLHRHSLIHCLHIFLFIQWDL